MTKIHSLIAIGVAVMMVLPAITPIDCVDSEQCYVGDYYLEFVDFEEDYYTKLNAGIDYPSRAISDVSDHKDGSIMIFDSEKVVTASEVRSLSDIINDGVPIILTNVNDNIVKSLRGSLEFLSSGEETQILAVDYGTKSFKSVYSVDGFDDEESALGEILSLMSNSRSESIGTLTGIEESYRVSASHCCRYGNEEYGTMNIETFYHKIADTSSNYDYFMVHYTLQGVCASGHSKSFLGVESDLTYADPVLIGQELIAYGPTTSSGTTTVSFDGSVCIDSGLIVAAGFSASWSRSYSDVSAIDQSDFLYEYMNVGFDINECTNSGYYTLLVEPGLMCSYPESNGEVTFYDTYSAEFCKVVIQGMWHNNFHTFTHSMQTSF